jgi:hypothetical protein
VVYLVTAPAALPQPPVQKHRPTWGQSQGRSARGLDLEHCQYSVTCVGFYTNKKGEENPVSQEPYSKNASHDVTSNMLEEACCSKLKHDFSTKHGYCKHGACT